MFQDAFSNETLTLCIIKFFNVLVVPKLMPLNVIFMYAKNNYTKLGNLINPKGLMRDRQSRSGAASNDDKKLEV